MLETSLASQIIITYSTFSTKNLQLIIMMITTLLLIIVVK